MRIRKINLLPISLIPEIGFAAGKGVSVGDVAGNIFSVGMDVRSVIKFVCVVAGISLILGSILQYKKYRQNPVETRFSNVIFTFVVGVSLILLSLIPMQVD